MAGLGGKNWTFEQEATSADINGYLADQVVMRFANAAARDAGFGGAGEPVLAEGMICTLDDTDEVLRYNGSAWAKISGSSGDDPILFNTNQVTTNTTIPSGKNGVSAGPITIGSGVTVTISSGSAWAIV